MPSGCALIPTSSISTTTSDSATSREPDGMPVPPTSRQSADQDYIGRKRFAAHKPSRDTHCYHALKYPPQSIALAEAFVPGSAEHRMIGNLIFDTELAEPAIGQINLHLRAQPPLRTQCKHISHQQHPDHQNRINRGTARV